jgi:transcriptional regulator of arginine metabolism
MSSKVQRQQLIAKLVGQHNVSNQPQLVDLLATEGIVATQATVSRDLDDLGAVKVRVPGGDSVYAIPDYEPARLAPHDQLRRVMGEWVAEVDHSGNLVVVRTPPGCAHVVASALDRSGMTGLLGTVAGDDTMLCIATEDVGGPALAAQLRELAGLTGGRT